jgi:DNA-binding transcriptional MerR regulator
MAESESGGDMLIGEVAERVGLSQRTLRYWEEIGLLRPSERRDGGYRVYGEADLQKIDHILQLKRLLGFSLIQIKEMVEAEELRKDHRRAYHDDPSPDTRLAHLRGAIEIATRELDRLESHISDVQIFRDKVVRRLARYQAEAESLACNQPAAHPTQGGN